MKAICIDASTRKEPTNLTEGKNYEVFESPFCDCCYLVIDDIPKLAVYNQDRFVPLSDEIEHGKQVEEEALKQYA